MTDQTRLLVRLEASTTKLEKQLIKAVNLTTNEARRMDKEFGRANQRVERGFKSAAQSASVFQRELEKSDRQLESLRASIDPAYAATLRLSRQEEILSAALGRGAISAKEHAVALQILRTQSDVAAASADRLGTSVLRTSRNFGGSHQIQNVAFQIGDFATQVGSGQRASVALGQQLPQLLGGFGALGAVLGAVAAIGIPLTAAFFRMGQGAEEADDKVESFEESVSNSISTLQRAEDALALAGSGGLVDLERQYGEVTEAVKELAKALAEIEARAATKQVEASLSKLFDDNFADALNDKVGGSAQAYLEASEDDIKSLRKEIDLLEQELSTALQPNPSQKTVLKQMQDELAVLEGRFAYAGELAKDIDVDQRSLERVRELTKLIPEALSGGNTDGVADNISELRSLLEDLGVEVREGFGAELTRAEALIRRADQALAEADDTAGDLSVTLGQIDMSNPINQASFLAKQLQSTLEIANALNRALNADAGIQDKKKKGGLDFGLKDKNGGQDGTFGEENLEFGDFGKPKRRTVFKLPKTPKPTRGGGGASRGGRQTVKKEKPFFETAEKEIEALNRQIEAIGRSEREVVKLEASYRLLDEAKRRGIDLDKTSTSTGRTLRKEIEAKAEAIAEASEAYRNGIASQQQFETVVDGLSDSIADAIVNARSLGDAFAGVLKRIAADIISSQISNLLTSVFAPKTGAGGGGGFLADFFGQLLSGKRASGGPVSGGRSYLVGERGPEIFTPASGGRITANRDISGGGYRVKIAVHNSLPGVRVQETTDQSGNIRFDVLAREAVQDVLGAGGADKTLRNRFGIVPVGS